MSILEENRGPRQGAAVAAPAPYISVVVPVRNEAGAIRATLTQLLSQDYPHDRFEVIVADGESTDNTRAIVEQLATEHANLRLLANPRRWSSAARNVAIRAAHGELIVVVDGHCDLASDRYLVDLADAFERTGADCLGRPQPLEIDEASLLQQAIGRGRKSRLGHHPASYIYSGRELRVPAHSVGVAYRREIFDRIGLFDESFDACEDVELNHRVDTAGLSCVLVPALRVAYHPRASLGGLFRQMDRYGRGRMRLLRKHPATFSPLGFAPAALVLATLLAPLGFLWSWPLGLWGLAPLALYLCVVMLFSAGLAISARRPSLLPLLPVVFVTLHFGAGAGILREALWPHRGLRSA